eukprot:gene19303-25951_t
MLHQRIGQLGCPRASSSKKIAASRCPIKPSTPLINPSAKTLTHVCRSSSSDDEESISALEQRIKAGEFGDVGSTKEQLTRPIRKLLAADPTGLGRIVSFQLARLGRFWIGQAQKRMPVATGDIREIIGEPVFVPLYKLFLVYGKIFRLSFGPKNFVIISDAKYARQILMTNAEKYSKGILSEILDFVMGTGLIPADGEIWKMRRRAIVPALHKKYVASMVGMFGECVLFGCGTLEKATAQGKSIDMENYFSRLALDIIGKAVFNYDFDSLSHDDPVIKAVYTVLREAEHRSTAPIPYWNIPGITALVPRQKRCVEALVIVNDTLDALIAKCKKLVEDEDQEFVEEFLSEADPSILHFLLASGDQISSKQMRDDLMTMLIAGHETTAAVLTWTFHLLAQHPEVAAKVRDEVDTVLGDRMVTVDDMKALRYTTRVINESMRLYPQPPVLIRRALEDDKFDDYTIHKGQDLFISIWNLHHSSEYWPDAEAFRPERFPVDSPIPNEITENFAYLPFGGGRRKCIGDQFALFESICAISMLMRRYEFNMAPDAPPVGMTTGATIHTTNGLHMTITPRVNRPSPPMEGHANGTHSTHEPALATAGASPSGKCPFSTGSMPSSKSSNSGAGMAVASGEVSVSFDGGVAVVGEPRESAVETSRS